jgi:hypothetical protein
MLLSVPRLAANRHVLDLSGTWPELTDIGAPSFET